MSYTCGAPANWLHVRVHAVANTENGEEELDDVEALKQTDNNGRVSFTLNVPLGANDIDVTVNINLAGYFLKTRRQYGIKSN